VSIEWLWNWACGNGHAGYSGGIQSELQSREYGDALGGSVIWNIAVLTPADGWHTFGKNGLNGELTRTHNPSYRIVSEIFKIFGGPTMNGLDLEGERWVPFY